MSSRSRSKSKLVPLNDVPVASPSTVGLTTPTTATPLASPLVATPLVATPAGVVVTPVAVTASPSKNITPISTLEFSNDQGVIRDATVEEELLRYGYVPSDKLLVRCGQNLECPYIKAVNKNGQTVFVELDEPGQVAVENGNLVTVESREANIVPYNAKISELECAKLDVCGIAFDCRDGVCVLKRQDQVNNPSERNFIIVERNMMCNRVATFERSPISYPIVKLSEIRQNPDLVVQLVNECTKRLRNTAHCAALQEYTQSVNQLNALTVAVNSLIATNDFADKKLKENIAVLENWNWHYHQNPPQTVECKEKARKLQVNLRIRNQLVVDLLGVASAFNARRAEFQRLTNEIVELNRFLTERLCSIDYVQDA